MSYTHVLRGGDIERCSEDLTDAFHALINQHNCVHEGRCSVQYGWIGLRGVARRSQLNTSKCLRDVASGVSETRGAEVSSTLHPSAWRSQQWKI